MTHLTLNELLEILKKDVLREGSQRALAKHLKITESYLSDVLRCRRTPGRRILNAYQLQAVTTTTYKKTRDRNGLSAK